MPAATVTAPEIDLERRVSDAAAVEAPLASKLNDLEARLALAVERSDYRAADKLKAAIDPARVELAIAHANTEALRGALAATAAQREADARAIQQQRARDQAHGALAAARAAEQDALEEIARYRAEITVLLEAIRTDIAAALACEQRAGLARDDQYNALLTLGEQPLRRLAPTDVTALVERDEVLAAIWSSRAQDLRAGAA